MLPTSGSVSGGTSPLPSDTYLAYARRGDPTCSALVASITGEMARRTIVRHVEDLLAADLIALNQWMREPPALVRLSDRRALSGPTAVTAAQQLSVWFGTALTNAAIGLPLPDRAHLFLPPIADTVRAPTVTDMLLRAPSLQPVLSTPAATIANDTRNHGDTPASRMGQERARPAHLGSGKFAAHGAGRQDSENDGAHHLQAFRRDGSVAYADAGVNMASTTSNKEEEDNNGDDDDDDDGWGCMWSNRPFGLQPGIGHHDPAWSAARMMTFATPGSKNSASGVHNPMGTALSAAALPHADRTLATSGIDDTAPPRTHSSHYNNAGQDDDEHDNWGDAFG